MSRKNKLNELSEIQLSNNDAGIKKHKSVNYTKENENTLTFDDTSCTRIDPLVFPIKEEMDTDISEDLQSTGASRIEGSTTNNDNSEKSKDNVIYFVEPKEEVGIRDEYVDIVSDIEIKKEAIDDPMDSEEPYSTDFLSVDFKEALSSNEAHYEDHNSSIINQQDTSINTDAENGQSNIAEECSNLQTTSSKKKSRSGAGNTPIESQSKNKKMPIMATKEMKNRNVLTLYEKRQVLLGLDSGLNYKDLMKKFKLSRSAVYEIKKKREKIMAATSQSKKVNICRKTLHTPRQVEFDKCLYEWFSQKRSEGIAISGPTLIARAKCLQEEMNIMSDMGFSQGWLGSFKRRHGIQQLSYSCEKRSADTDRAIQYCIPFENVVNEHKLSLDLIYNIAETELCWKCLPQKTLAGNEETSAAGFEQNKEKITILTCSNASGNHKLKLLVIGESKCPQSLKGIQNLPVCYKSQKNATMSKLLFKEWFFEQFVPAALESMKKTGKSDSKCLLLLNNCTDHPDETELVSNCGQIFACCLPPNAMSLNQPMSQGIIRSLKCSYKNEFMLQMINSNKDPVAFQRQFTIKHAIMNVAAAWDDVKVVTLLRARLKLLPKAIKQIMGKHVHSGTQNKTSKDTDTDFENISETIKYSPLNYRLQNLDNHDLKQWITENVGNHSVFSYGPENIECILNADNDHNSSSDDEKGTKTSWDEAEKSMETFLKFIERTPCFSTDENQLGYNLKRTFIAHKVRHQKVAEIRKDLKNAINLSY